MHKDYYRKGIATKLMQVLIKYAEEHDVKTMVGGIDASNEASIISHKKLGFTYSGTIKNAGYNIIIQIRISTGIQGSMGE